MIHREIDHLLPGYFMIAFIVFLSGVWSLFNRREFTALFHYSALPFAFVMTIPICVPFHSCAIFAPTTFCAKAFLAEIAKI